MKILLLRLKSLYSKKKDRYFNYLSYPPISLQILAGLTPKIHDIKIIDEEVEKIDYDSDYDLIALTSSEDLDLEHFKEVYSKFKEKNKNIPFIIGGLITSSSKLQYIKKNALIDSIVIGEGEDLWPKILQDVKKNKLKRLYKNKKWFDLYKLDSTTLPRRDLTKNKNYTFHSMQISRGCLHRCNFCSVPLIEGFHHRAYNIKRLIHEVEDSFNYPAGIKRYIHFDDNDIANLPDFKLKLFKKLIDYDIIWSSFCSISIVKNKKLLNVFSKSGCLKLLIGFDSFNPNVLKNINKPCFYKIEDYKKAVKILHDHGIQADATIMIGHDNDKKGVAKNILNTIIDINVDNIMLYLLHPIQNTEIFKKLKDEGRLFKKPYQYSKTYLTFKPKNMTPKELIEEFEWFKDNAPKNSIYRDIKRVVIGKSIINPNISLSNKIDLLKYHIKKRVFKF